MIKYVKKYGLYAFFIFMALVFIATIASAQISKMALMTCKPVPYSTSLSAFQSVHKHPKTQYGLKKKYLILAEKSLSKKYATWSYYNYNIKTKKYVSKQVYKWYKNGPTGCVFITTIEPEIKKELNRKKIVDSI